MKQSAKAAIAAGMLAAALMLTGCAAGNAGTKQTPQAEQTAQTESTQTPEAEGEPGEMPVSIGGKELDAKALREDKGLLLPLGETARALGFDVQEKTEETDDKERRSVELTRGEDKITVLWSVSDNTARDISWQKNGLLIPVDARLTTKGETVYVPAAFFEKAANVMVTEADGKVRIEKKESTVTPPTDTQEENGAQ